MGIPVAIEEVAGKTFGKLTARELVIRRNSKGEPLRYWRCDCACGREAVVWQHSLRRGSAKSCGSHVHRVKNDLTGRTFGRLTVVGLSPHPRKILWDCACACGGRATPRTDALVSGKTQSCGCLKTERSREAVKLPDGIAAMRMLQCSYRWGAKSRGLPWKLTEEKFKALVTAACHYCGTPPSRVLKGWDKQPMTGAFNGVDRKDSSLGYFPANVVPCCKTCQYAKNDMPYEAFLGYLERLRVFRNQCRDASDAPPQAKAQAVAA